MSFGGKTTAKAENESEDKKENSHTTGTQTTQLKLEQEAIDKIVEDVLGSETGLASIFASENVAGLYGGTTSAQASGDLVANLTGEIAKLTGEQTTYVDEITAATSERYKKNRSLEVEAEATFL